MRHLLRYSVSRCLIALLLLIIVPALSAQTGNVQVIIEETNVTNFPEVSMLLSVTDAQGRAMRGLDPGNFVLTEDGTHVDIESLDIVPANQVELRVVMVLDISGSIAWKPGTQIFDQQRLDQVKQAAIGFVTSLQPKDEIALVYFGDSAWTEEGFTPDHNKVMNKLNNLRGENLQNYTALYNGAFESIRLAGEQKTGRRAVVLMTDGKNRLPEELTSIGLDTVVREASERHVRVYVIGIASPDLSEPDLRAMTSDGRYYYIDQPEYLATAYNEIANEIRHQYKIAFTSRVRADAQSHGIELSIRTPDGINTTNTTYRSPNPTPTSIPSPTLVSAQVPVPTPAISPAITVVLPETITPGEAIHISAEPTSSTIPLWLIVLIIGIFLFLLLILAIVFILIHKRNQQKIPETQVPQEPNVVPLHNPFPVSSKGKGCVPPARTEVINQPGMPTGLLTAQTGTANPAEIRLSANQEYTIGRAPDCSMVLDNPRVSSLHARIRFMENGFTIIDMGSTNGTWCNGKRISRLRLQHNDTIEIGGTTLVYTSLQN